MKPNSTNSAFSFLYFCLFSALIFPTTVFGQVLNDYRSAQTGNFSALSTWQVYNGTAWVAATTTPIIGNFEHSIEIRNGHTVTQDAAGATICRVTVDIGGALIVATNTVVRDSTGDELTDNGSVTVNTGGAWNYLGTNPTAQISGTFTFNGGQLVGGITFVQAGGTFNISTAAAKTMNTVTIQSLNNGFINLNDGSPVTSSTNSFTNNFIMNVNGNYILNASMSNNDSLKITQNGALSITSLTNGTNAVIAGSGTLALATLNNSLGGVLSPGLAPGSPCGTFFLSAGGYTGGTLGGKLNIDILDASGIGTGNDLLSVNGSVNLTGTTLNVTELANAPAGTYTIINSGSTVTGPFAATNLPAGYSITYNASAVVLVKANLPLTWISFTSQVDKNSIRLDWVTGVESNTDYFSVEQSTDGSTFTPVGKVKAGGNTVSSTPYTFTTDPAPPAATNFYRIRQVDLDGKYSYSQVIAVRMNTTAAFAVSAFPNPVEGELNVKIEGVQPNEDLIFELIGSNGMRVYQSMIHTAGITTIRTFPRPAVSAGLYFYRVIRKMDGRVTTGRIVLK